MVAGLRASSSVPYSVIPGVVDCVNSMISSTVDYVQSEAVKFLRDAGVSSRCRHFFKATERHVQ